VISGKVKESLRRCQETGFFYVIHIFNFGGGAALPLLSDHSG
jgi:hypothetical protein